MTHKHYKTITDHARRIAQDKKVRFIAVGITNTVVDVLVFNILVQVCKLDLVAANIISTTVAMAGSFLLNKRAVFRDTDPAPKQVVLFLAVTLSGIWIIQTVVMVQVFNFLQGEFAAQSHPLLVWFLQNVAKAAGIAISAVWNYLGYSRIVFKGKP